METIINPLSSGRREGEKGELVLVGMGLWDNNGISLSGIDAASTADEVYAELYTSLMPGLDVGRLEKEIGKRITVLKRRDLEEDAVKGILGIAKNRKIALLVPGEPLAATTHVDLRLRAFDMGIRTRVIHAASIFCAAASLAGLQHYKFGKTVTVPIPQEAFFPLSPYDTIYENLSRGLHTLLLLDLNAEQGRYLTVNQALNLLMSMEGKRKKGILTGSRLTVGLARVGSQDPVVKCNYIDEVMKSDFGAPPHTLIIPGDLHFMEASVLVKLFGAPPSIMEAELRNERYEDF